MKLKVGVFFGGKSVEHEVSIITALQAIENMDKEKYDVLPIYISKDNKMYCGRHLYNVDEYKDIEKLIKKSIQVTLVQKNNRVELLKCNKKIYESPLYNNIDIAFPIVHGTNVEDGTLQGYLNLLDIPMVGSNILASACGMDKYVCKCILKENKIPVLDGVLIDVNEYNRQDKCIEKIEANLDYPVIVKPVNLGSSVGIKIAKDVTELKEAIEDAFEYCNKIIVEKAIEELREINCSVVGDDEFAEASECEEPVKTDEILSYKDKYVGEAKTGGSKHMNASVIKLPAEIEKSVKEKIQEYSINTFKALGCSGVIRVDCMIDKKTNKIYVNEVNTIPGCLSFHLWKATGLSYTELLNKLINLALKKYREEKNITYSFDTNILSNFSLNGTKGGKMRK